MTYAEAAVKLDEIRQLDPALQITRADEVLDAFTVFWKECPNQAEFSRYTGRLVLLPSMLWVIGKGVTDHLHNDLSGVVVRVGSKRL